MAAYDPDSFPSSTQSGNVAARLHQAAHQVRQFLLERRNRQGSCQEDGLVAAALPAAADVRTGQVVGLTERVRGRRQPHALPVGKQIAIAVPADINAAMKPPSA